MMNKDEISENNNKIKEQFKISLGDKFNEEKFKKDTEEGKLITIFKIKEYEKEEPPKENDKFKNQGNIQNDSGLAFQAKFENGKYIAYSSNGIKIESNNIDHFHKKMAEFFYQDAKKKNRDPRARLILGNDTSKKEQEETKRSFAKNFIKQGVAPMGDVPQDKAFWDNLKNEYISSGHSMNEWEKVTRFIPKEYKNGKTEEKSTQPKTNLQNLMKKMAEEGKNNQNFMRQHQRTL